MDRRPQPHGDEPPRADALLPARTAVARLAEESVTAAAAAMARVASASGERPAVLVDPQRVALAYTSERSLRIDGAAPDIWAALSGFFPTADGWLRTHANYPHHAAALRRALALSPEAGADELAHALVSTSSEGAAGRIVASGGVAVAVAPERPDLDARLRREPLVQVVARGATRPRRVLSPTRAAPLAGMRVLDLTRVIAGPVATRTLALAGADVLRIDSPSRLEARWQHLDTGHGKRSALLDLASRRGARVLAGLLHEADAVVYGYRPASAERWALDPQTLADEHPGLVIAQLSAWGFDERDRSRRGFDSIVQAASGIALIESPGGGRPGALPAQALDHSAGYLLAAAVIDALAERDEHGGTRLVRTSLRRVAAELLGMPRRAEPPPAVTVSDHASHLQHFDVAGRTLTTVAPAPRYDGGPTRFDAPRPWGDDDAAWW
ncbi:CoA transferase [Microbacterium sp. LRZ72]|uniref:CoA transferase n=1 Tax=Microbacterium sp. LRZ72 TaxID=2942481 RepID=UPI0029A1DA32|nr:CoA transferase [Microbacterium sp. LRZ72]MDX2375688.1 CoA transferase [Microbacterium sp. LRZ72]